MFPTMNEMKAWTMQNQLVKKMETAAANVRKVLAKNNPTMAEMNAAHQKLKKAHAEYKKVMGKNKK
jgi:hypothetical protein